MLTAKEDKHMRGYIKTMKMKQMLSLGIAAVMSISMPMAAFAITTNTTITKNDGGNHQIDDGIDYSGKDYALETSNNGTNVTVKGYINSSDGAGVSGKDAATITVRGGITSKNACIIAQNNAEVTISGDLKSDHAGVVASDNSIVTVEGAIKVDDGNGNQYGGLAVDLKIGSTLRAESIDSNVAGIQSSLGSTVIIDKDVEVNEKWGSVSVLNNNNKVLIGGDVKAKNNGNIKIFVNSASDNNEIAVGGKIQNDGGGLTLTVSTDSNGNIKSLPEIVIGEITDPDKINVRNHIYSELSEEKKQQVLDNIKYIVNSNSEGIDGKGSFTITKTDGGALSRDKADKYDVAKRQEQILVKVAVNNGYELGGFSAGKNNTYVRNADGSYTVTVADGGGINIEALIKAIEADPNPIKPTPIGGGSDRDTSTGGSWSGSGALMTFRKADGSLAKNEWADIYVNGKLNRYRFDENGNIKTGWYTDETGASYYLNESAGSDYGAMCTGWMLINGEWYFLMPYNAIRNGAKLNAGTMLKDVMTPDGFRVNADGIWIQ